MFLLPYAGIAEEQRISMRTTSAFNCRISKEETWVFQLKCLK